MPQTDPTREELDFLKMVCGKKRLAAKLTSPFVMGRAVGDLILEDRRKEETIKRCKVNRWIEVKDGYLRATAAGRAAVSKAKVKPKRTVTVFIRMDEGGRFFFATSERETRPRRCYERLCYQLIGYLA